jgi:hypothetical protein
MNNETDIYSVEIESENPHPSYNDIHLVSAHPITIHTNVQNNISRTMNNQLYEKIRKDPCLFALMDNQPENICIDLIKINPFVLQYIKKQTVNIIDSFLMSIMPYVKQKCVGYLDGLNIRNEQYTNEFNVTLDDHITFVNKTYTDIFTFILEIADKQFLTINFYESLIDITPYFFTFVPEQLIDSKLCNMIVDKLPERDTTYYKQHPIKKQPDSNNVIPQIIYANFLISNLHTYDIYSKIKSLGYLTIPIERACIIKDPFIINKIGNIDSDTYIHASINGYMYGFHTPEYINQLALKNDINTWHVININDLTPDLCKTIVKYDGLLINAIRDKIRRDCVTMYHIPQPLLTKSEFVRRRRQNRVGPYPAYRKSAELGAKIFTAEVLIESIKQNEKSFDEIAYPSFPVFYQDGLNECSYCDNIEDLFPEIRKFNPGIVDMYYEKIRSRQDIINERNKKKECCNIL